MNSPGLLLIELLQNNILKKEKVMGRVRDEFISETGGYSVNENPVLADIKQEKIKLLEEEIKNGKATYEKIQSLAFLKNGGTDCNVCGFHMFDECICSN